MGDTSDKYGDTYLNLVDCPLPGKPIWLSRYGETIGWHRSTNDVNRWYVEGKLDGANRSKRYGGKN